MYKTLNIELTNGKRDDASQTIYIQINQSTNCWSYHIALETNGDGFDYAEAGEVKPFQALMNAAEWQETIVAAIADMLRNQTVVEDAEDYLAGEGSWMVDLTADDFAADKWDEHSN